MKILIACISLITATSFASAPQTPQTAPQCAQNTTDPRIIELDKMIQANLEEGKVTTFEIEYSEFPTLCTSRYWRHPQVIFIPFPGEKWATDEELSLALVRRFKSIEFTKPDSARREEILRHYASAEALELDDSQIATLTEKTDGHSLRSIDRFLKAVAACCKDSESVSKCIDLHEAELIDKLAEEPAQQ